MFKKKGKFYERLKNTISQKKYRIGPGPKINVLFHSLNGETDNLILNHGITVEQMLKIYKKRIIGEYNIKDELTFCFEGRKIGLGDQTPVEKYFGFFANPKVIVSDYIGQIDKISEEEKHLIHLYGELLSEENIA